MKASGAVACPKCGCQKSGVVDTRYQEQHNMKRRRRECSTCNNRYTTYERCGDGSGYDNLLTERISALNEKDRKLLTRLIHRMEPSPIHITPTETE